MVVILNVNPLGHVPVAHGKSLASAKAEQGSHISSSPHDRRPTSIAESSYPPGAVHKCEHGHKEGLDSGLGFNHEAQWSWRQEVGAKHSRIPKSFVLLVLLPPLDNVLELRQGPRLAYKWRVHQQTQGFTIVTIVLIYVVVTS